MCISKCVLGNLSAALSRYAQSNVLEILHCCNLPEFFKEGRIDTLYSARWALNNVATYGTPDCEPTLARLHSDPSFMSKMAQYTKTGNSTNVDMLQSGPSGKVCLAMIKPPACVK